MIIALLLALQLQDPIAWQSSVEDGLKAAEKSGKPVFIFFGCN